MKSRVPRAFAVLAAAAFVAFGALPAIGQSESTETPPEWARAIDGHRAAVAPELERAYLTLDLGASELTLRTPERVIRRMKASAGKGSVLRLPSGEILRFDTPRGAFTIRTRVANPVWHKPDWAFVEERRKVPSPNHPSRLDRTIMGKYALNFGHTYFIHGTATPGTLGRPASHGCVRLGAADIKALYHWPGIVGMRFYVYGRRNPSMQPDSAPLGPPRAAPAPPPGAELAPYERAWALLAAQRSEAAGSVPYLVLDAARGSWSLRLERGVLAVGQIAGLPPCAEEGPCAAYRVRLLDGKEMLAGECRAVAGEDASGPRIDADCRDSVLTVRAAPAAKKRAAKQPATKKGAAKKNSPLVDAASSSPAAIAPPSTPEVPAADLALWARVLEPGSSAFRY